MLGVRIVVTVSLPQNVKPPHDLDLGGGAGTPSSRIKERLRRAFELYITRFRTEKRQTCAGTMPLLQLSGGTTCDLFPLLLSEQAKVMGRERDLPSQLGLCYEGTQGGFDALHKFSVHPLGCLCSVKLSLDQPGPAKWIEGDDVAVTVSQVVVVNDAGENPLSAAETPLELHKIVSFVTWIEWKYANGPEWNCFPKNLTFSPFPATQCSMLKSIYGSNGSIADRKGKLYRGFLLYGPAGTGKSKALKDVISKLRMTSVWGEKDGDPIIGSGASLKGGLQGDLEMRIYALFMRANAAPWLPCAITIDEIDFTAPSRKNAGSGEGSGGNLWLKLLSDNEREANLVFFATTNVRTNVLEQLVDRLDNTFVGLQAWESHLDLLKWDASARANSPVKLMEDYFNFPEGYGWCMTYQAVMMGMTPRAVLNLQSLEDVRRVQLENNPWPTLTRGSRCIVDLLDSTNKVVDDDCKILMEFLFEAASQHLLTGRLLIDLTRLRERLIVVDVEVLKQKLDNADLFLSTTSGNQLDKFSSYQVRDLFKMFPDVTNDDIKLAANYNGATIKAAVESTGSKFSRSAKENFIKWCRDVSSKKLTYGHVHTQRRQGSGQAYTRSFVLSKQRDEQGLWVVLANVAAYMHATHCTYVSDDFLHGMAGGGSQGAHADERNRDAIALTLLQYLSNCDCAVMVMPLRYARIQKAEDGSFGSSSINASEVWDMISSGWRCNVERKQLFALVASEVWELDAVANSGTIVWPSSDYRERLAQKNAEEQSCAKCNNKFQPNNYGQLKNCSRHTGVVWTQINDKEWDTAPTLTKWRESHASCKDKPSFGQASKSKWSCCGKQVFDDECPASKHEAVTPFDKAKGVGPHARLQGFWCNKCCNCVDQVCE